MIKLLLESRCYKMKNEKQNEKKSGNPIFILIIFLILLTFVFIIPDIYKKYHGDVSRFFGITSKKTVEPSSDNNDDREVVSDYYQIDSSKSLSFNELTITNVNLKDDILSFDIDAKNADLENLHYYMEFYKEKSAFLGRRILKGTINGSEHYKLDVNGLNLTLDSYFTISHIEDDSIPKFKLDTDESGIGTITCTKNSETYIYDFAFDKLVRAEYKYSYKNDNLDVYSSTLLGYQKLSKEYDKVNGVTSVIAENNGEFVYTLELDYSEIETFNIITNQYKFKKDMQSYIIKFKMDAEGYKCL